MTDAASNWQPDPEELRAIHAATAETVKETPVFSLGELSRRCGGTVVLKAENMQRTGSFKLRGSLAKLAGRDAGNCRGVVAGSAGNHGQALAYAARARGIPCTVFMPADAAISKVDAVTAFGAEVVLEGSAIDECLGGREATGRGGRSALRAPLRRPRRDPWPGRRRPRAARAGPRPGEGDRPGRRRRADQRDLGGARVRRRRGRDRRGPGGRVRRLRPLAGERRAAGGHRALDDRRRDRGEAAGRPDPRARPALGRGGRRRRR